MIKPQYGFKALEVEAGGASLQRQSLQSSLITFGSQPLKLLIGVGTTSVLARLLTPADFGLVAMALPLFALVESVNALGLGTATVQRARLDHPQASAVFWLSVAINGGLVGVLLLAAPLLAQFYQDDRLRWVIPALTLGMASVFVSLQHQSLLARQMRFGALTAIEVGALALGAAAALGAAVRGWGYWALVLQLVVFQLVQGLGYWAVCGWRPAAPRLGIPAEVRTMLAYGANLSGFHLVNRVGMEMDRVLVGYVNGASALGLYAVAYNWAYFPFNQVYFPLLNVAIASLSRAAADDRQYRSQSRQLLMLMFGLCLPALAFLGVAGQSFVLVLLGDQWLEALPIFRVLVLSVFIGSFYRVTKWIYISTGQTQRQFRWGFVHTPVVVAAAALGTIWGPLGVAWGVTLASLGLTYPALAFCLRPTPLTLADFAEAVWRPTLASILAAGLLALRQGMAPVDLGAGPNLLVNAALFAAAYGVLLVLLPGGWQDLKQAYGDLRALAGPRNDS